MLAPATHIDDQLYDLLGLSRVPVVVDIGADSRDGGPPPYRDMLGAGLCRLIGFEPQASSLALLQEHASVNETYLPYIVGTGEPGTLKVTQAPGCTSLLEPDPARLPLLNLHEDFMRVTERVPVETVRLDDIAEIDGFDFLKIDIQGGELDVFCDGITKMQGAVMVQTEVNFFRTYIGQPGFSEIDDCLRSMGFVFHCWADMKRWPISPARIGENERQGLLQAIEADVVYVRDWTQPGNMTHGQWRMLAFLAHHVYRSYDLALRAIVTLAGMGELSEDAPQTYSKLLRGLV